MNTAHLSSSSRLLLPPDVMALLLRVGLGLVILAGGSSKLSQLLDPARQSAVLDLYWSPLGYVNAFFAERLSTGVLGGVLTPWMFLTSLSAFEFLAGALLVAGIFVRPLALVWGILFWAFVVALPVATTAGIDPALATHRSPALLILIRDIGLSGLFFVLFTIGSGRYSVDRRWFGPAVTRTSVDWDALGLVVRLSLALPLLVGGLFHGAGHIQTFGAPAWILLAVGGCVLLNLGARAMGVAVVALILVLMVSTFDLDRSLVANMNAVKREYGLLAGAVLLAACGGGRCFSLPGWREGPRRLLQPGAGAVSMSP